MAKTIRITSLLLLMSICAGCCETCGHSTHGHQPASSSGSVSMQPLQRIGTGLLAIKYSIKEQDEAVSQGDIEQFLDDMNWMLRAIKLTRSDIDSLAGAQQPEQVRQFMEASDPIQTLYGSDRFRSFKQAASPAARARMEAGIQQLQDMGLGNWSGRILQAK